MVNVAAPAPVAAAAAMTVAGRAWMRELPAILEALALRWSIKIGKPFSGGTASYVAAAHTYDGTEVVVKVALPPGVEGHANFTGEMAALLGGGDGYVRVLDHDVGVRALLLERLGATLAEAGLPIQTQLETIAATLHQAWVPVAAASALPDLHDKGLWLADFIGRTWAETGRPCSRRAVESAQRVATERAEAARVSASWLLHGDGHANNLLRAADGKYRLVDPDGVTGEPEYDLAIPIRELPPADLGQDPVRAAKALCVVIADATPANVDAELIWRWAFVERMSTGLLCRRLDHHHWAGPLLTIADDWSRDF